MRHVLSRLTALCYWSLRHLFRAYFNDGYDAFKAMVIVGSVQVCIVFAVLSAVSLVLGRRLISFGGISGALAIGTLIIAIAVADNLRFKEWVAYELEFERLEARVRRRIALAVCLGTVVVVTGTLVLASAASRLPLR